MHKYNMKGTKEPIRHKESPKDTNGAHVARTLGTQKTQRELKRHKGSLMARINLKMHKALKRCTKDTKLGINGAPKV